MIPGFYGFQASQQADQDNLLYSLKHMLLAWAQSQVAGLGSWHALCFP